MALTITDELMTSDVSGHSAKWSPDAAANGEGAWLVSWLPARLLNRNEAVTAMTLAEELGRDEHRRPWPAVLAHAQAWADELHVSLETAHQRIEASPAWEVDA